MRNIHQAGSLESGGLEAGGLEARATDFGSGIALIRLGVQSLGVCTSFKFAPRATDFGSGVAHACPPETI